MRASIADVLEGRARWCVVETRPKRRPNVSIKCQRPGCPMWRTLYWHPSRPLPQFCSHSCRNATTAERREPTTFLRGSEHPNWLGDKIARRSGRTRAGRMYRVGGPCERCAVSRSTDRHHVDGDTRNNDRCNIRLLCRRCHMIEDGRRVGTAEHMRAIQPVGTKARWPDGKGWKLTSEQRDEIRDRYARGGVLQRELASEYGVNQTLVSRIVRRPR